MPYQGTNFSASFRNRAVADPSRRMRQEARQIEQQEQERVREAETQASREMKELRRLADLQASNDRYNLESLSTFSNSVKSFVQDVVVKETIAQKEEQYYNDVLDAVKTPELAEQSTKEVDEAMQQSSNLHADLHQASTKMGDPEAAQAVRKLSGHTERAYEMRDLTTSGDTFASRMLTEMSSSEVMLTDDEGNEFKLSDPETAEQWDLAAGYLRYQEILKFRGSKLSAKVIATKLLPKLDTAITKQRGVWTQQKREETAMEGITAQLEDSYGLLMDENSTPESIAQDLQNMYKTLPALAGVMNPEGGAFNKTRDLVVGLIDSAFKTAKDPIGLGKKLNAALDQTYIEGHPAGKNKSLAQLYKLAFSPEVITRKAYAANTTRFNEEMQNQDAIGQERELEYMKILQEGNPSDTALQTFLTDFARDFPLQTERLNRMRTAGMLDMTIEESEAAAQTYLATHGEIPEEETRGFDPSIREKYQDKIVDKLWGADNTDDIERQQLAITNEIKKVRGIDTREKLMLSDAMDVEDELHDMLLPEAKRIYNAAQAANEPITKEKALQAASREIIKLLKTDSQYEHNRDGFVNYLNRASGIAGIEKKRVALEGMFKNAVSKLSSNSNALTDEVIIDDPSYLQLTPQGKPQPFFYELAKIDPQGRNAYEIYNAQGSHHDGFKPVTLPSATQAILDRTNLADGQLRRLMARFPSRNIARRYTKAIGSVDVPQVMRALGLQESTNRYDAQNDDAMEVDPELGPALGKYQIRWGNVIDWAKKYGMAHPVSQQQFKNSPAYQDRLAELAMADYIRQGLEASGGDVEAAVRMAAAAWYGGSGAMNQYDSPTYGKTEKYPSMQEYTRSIWTKYNSGSL